MSIEHQLQQLEAERIAAVIAIDLPYLDDLFDEELIYVHGSGLVHRKGELLAFIQDGARFLSIDRGELHVRPLENCAVMTGTFDGVLLQSSGGEQRQIRTFVTQVFRRSAERWRLFSFHACMRSGV